MAKLENVLSTNTEHEVSIIDFALAGDKDKPLAKVTLEDASGSKYQIQTSWKMVKEDIFNIIRDGCNKKAGSKEAGATLYTSFEAPTTSGVIKKAVLEVKPLCKVLVTKTTRYSADEEDQVIGYWTNYFFNPIEAEEEKI